MILSNGANVQWEGIREYKYWSCSDTYLSKSAKESNFGGEPRLVSGPDARILIKFGDLNRAIGPGKVITNAKLVLSPTAGTPPKEITVTRVLMDWNEGCGRPKMKIGEKSPLGATWDFRVAKGQMEGQRWAAGGCFKADEDRADKPTAAGTPASNANGQVVILGLEADVQAWYDRSATNYGWVLDTKGEPGQFLSSDAAVGRPTLVITYADAPPKPNAADLDVAYIERLPEFERYDPTTAYTYKDDVGIMDKPGLMGAQKWPRDGNLVTYRAHVRNHGESKAISKFHYVWFINGKAVRDGDVTDPLAPGLEVVIEAPAIWQDMHKDHREFTVAIKVLTDEPETCADNNFLRIYTHGLNLGIHVEQSVYDFFSKNRNGVGTYSFEDWVQWQFAMWNEVWMAKSKFSFAPDGSLERVRIQRIIVVPDGTLDKGGNHTPGGKPNFLYDGEWGFDWQGEDTRKFLESNLLQCETGLLHECSHQCGLIDLYVMNVDASLPDGTRGKVRMKNMTRGNIDPFGGLMGGGDTRNDTFVPSAIVPRNEPNGDPSDQFPLYEPTGLYAGWDVAYLNSTLGFRRGHYGEAIYDLPKLVFLRALDGAGKAIPNLQLSFFQMKGGEIKDEPPAFEGTTDAQGVFRLPNRPTGEEKEFRTLTRHTLRDNPFGRVDVVGSNGVFLVRARAFGQEEWQFLKAWELNVDYHRGNRELMLRDMRFNIASAVISDANIAAGKKVTLSNGADGSKMVDGDAKSSGVLPTEKGSFVVIDLGSDQMVAEVALTTYQRHDFWRQFVIYAYTEGVSWEITQPFGFEGDWGWAAGHQRDIDPSDFEKWTVSYRNAPRKARYIRIVNQGDTGGVVGEVTVRAAK